MTRRIRTRRSGSTLLEVTLTVALLTLFGVGALLMADSMSSAVRGETHAAHLEKLAHGALDEIAASLRAADAEAITPTGIQAPFSSDFLEFRRSVGFTGGVVVWSDPQRFALQYESDDPDNGLDDDGDGMIDEAVLVRIENPGQPGERRHVVCRWLRETLEGETPDNGLDDNGNQLLDEAGLCFERDEERLIVRLTLERPDGAGRLVQHTAERAVVLRNTGISAP